MSFCSIETTGNTLSGEFLLNLDHFYIKVPKDLILYLTGIDSYFPSIDIISCLDIT